MDLKRFRPSFLRNEELQTDSDGDLGFGTKIVEDGGRLINRDGTFNVTRTGLRIWTPYQWLVEMSWPRFFLIVFAFYCTANAIFASLFVLIGIEHLSGVQPGNLLENFANAFFFSVQTFTTVGYGAISPMGWSANIVAATDALFGLMAFALATGLFFARFSKPKAQIIFSENAIITPYQDIMSFQFRIANKRNNNIIDLEAKVTMSWIETKNGIRQRRFAGLPLERDKVFLFPLNWTIVHPIDEHSPLYEKTLKDLSRMQAEFLILIEGHDETFAQTVHTNSSYTCREMLYDVRFQPMYFTKGGRTVLELDRISEVEEVEEVEEGKKGKEVEKGKGSPSHKASATEGGKIKS